MKLKKNFNLFLIIAVAFSPLWIVNGMESVNYRIDKDSINFSGTEGSESSSYKLSDTTGEIGAGGSSSGNYNISAGYRGAEISPPTYISINNPGDVAMSPNIGGISGGTGDGTVVWNVETNSPSGYQVSIKASTSPALQSGSSSFANYTPLSAGTPDFAWGINNADSEFGYTVEGNNTAATFLDNGSVCNTGSSNANNSCWLNLSTSDQVVANSSSPNEPSGTDTTVKFKAQSGSSHIQPSGSYTATVTVTAVAL